MAPRVLRSPVRVGFGVALLLAAALAACSFITDFGALTSDLGKDAGADGAAARYVPASGEYAYTPLEGGGDYLDINESGSPIVVGFEEPFFVDVLPKSSDCWDLTMRLSTVHTHTYSFCNVEGGLAIVKETDSFNAAGSRAETVYTCGDRGSLYIPTALEPGHTLTQTACSGGVDASSVCGTIKLALDLAPSPVTNNYKFIGQTALTIAGAQVPVIHFTQDRTLIIAGEGTPRAIHEEWWFMVEGGLPIQHTGKTSITEAPDGCSHLSVVYSWGNDWVATALSPAPLP